ncbi:MATE family efflux transporter [Thalassospira povalilytica]|uniref:MATE family efflux transporter n=1 Tax=Thalassospira povalilytica TaxID=732237 RepID=UPI00147844F4|nr:oligosaccharide flippase family protein [Thalassospira povalilytica]
MSVGRSIAKQILLGAITQILIGFRGLIIMPLIIKSAGDSVFGSYVLISSIIILLLGTSSFGTNYNFRRDLPAANTYDDRRELLMSSISFRALTTAIFSLIIIVITPEIFAFLNQDVPFSPGLLALWLLGMTIQEIVTDYYRYTSRFGVYNLLMVGQIYLHIAAIVGLSFWWNSLSLDQLIALQAITLIVFSVPAFVWGVIRETGVSWPSTDWKKFWAGAKLGLPINGEFLVDFLVAFGDRYLIGLFLTVSAVGQYQAAYALAGLLTFFPKVISTVLTPALCKLWDTKNIYAAEQLFFQAVRFYIIIGVPFVVGTLLVGPSLIAVLTTPSIAESGRWAVALISVGIFFYGFVILISSAAFVIRHTKIIIYANIVAVTVNILLNLVFLQVYPNVSVPAAISIASYGVAFAYALSAVRATFVFTFDVSTIFCVFFASFVMAITLWFAGYSPGGIKLESELFLASKVALGAVVYFIALFFAGGLSKADLELVFSSFQRSKEIDECPPKSRQNEL